MKRKGFIIFRVGWKPPAFYASDYHRYHPPRHHLPRYQPPRHHLPRYWLPPGKHHHPGLFFINILKVSNCRESWKADTLLSRCIVNGISVVITQEPVSAQKITSFLLNYLLPVGILSIPIRPPWFSLSFQSGIEAWRINIMLCFI